MRTNFSDLDIRFTIGDTRFQALNIIYERFLRTVPSHSHGSGSYEIHYIPRGYGRARINGRFYDIVPGTLYVTGPHVEHAQTPHLEDPMCEYCIYLKTEKKRRSQPSAGPQPDGRERALSLFEGTTFWFGRIPECGFSDGRAFFRTGKPLYRFSSCRWSCCYSSSGQAGAQL